MPADELVLYEKTNICIGLIVKMNGKFCAPVACSSCHDAHTFLDRWNPHQQNAKQLKLWQLPDI